MSYDATLYELMTEMPDSGPDDPDYVFWRIIGTDVARYLNSL